MQNQPLRFFSIALLFASVSIADNNKASVYVAGYVSNTVYAVNPETNTITATIPTGDQPSYLTASADGERLYVASQNSSEIGIINTRANRQIGTIPTPFNPFDLAITPDNKLLFVTSPGVNQVGVYNLQRKTWAAVLNVPNAPYRVAIHPDGLRAFVTTANGVNLVVIDTRTLRVERQIPLGLAGTAIQISPNGSRLYVRTEYAAAAPESGPNAIWAIDAASYQVVGQARAFLADILVLSADGRRLYVIESGQFTMRNAATLNLQSAGPAVGSSLSMAILPGETRAYVADFVDNVTRVVDIPNAAVVALIPTGAFPYGVTAIPRDDR